MTDAPEPNKIATRLIPVGREDVPAVQGLIASIMREYGCVLNIEHDDPHLRDPGEYFRSRGGEFWVVKEKGQLAATVGVLLRGNEGELKCLYVHPAHRKRGWGRTLTEHVIRFVRRAGKTRVVLWSDTRFEAAHRLYRRMGFKQEGLRDLHDSNDTREYGFCRTVRNR